MTSLTRILAPVIKIFTDNQVRFLEEGAYMVVLQGYPCCTSDLA